jgi:hypothetical protein
MYALLSDFRANGGGAPGFSHLKEYLTLSITARGFGPAPTFFSVLSKLARRHLRVLQGRISVLLHTAQPVGRKLGFETTAQ